MLYATILLEAINVRQLFAVDDLSGQHSQTHLFIAALRVRRKLNVSAQALWSSHICAKASFSAHASVASRA